MSSESGAPRVPLQRGIRRTGMGREGTRRDNELTKIKAIVGNDLSCLRFLFASNRVRVPPWALMKLLKFFEVVRSSASASEIKSFRSARASPPGLHFRA